MTLPVDILPTACHAGRVLTSVAVPLLDGVSPFELGVLCEVFGIDRSTEGLPRFDFRVCAERPGEPIPTKTGYDVVARHGLDACADADLVAVPAALPHETYPEALLDVLRDAAERGAWVMSVCSGAYVLGEAGLLDGRRCTTHWMYAADLARRFPLAEVDPDVLFVEDGRLLTSAGTAAGIDLALHLVRRELGSAVATGIARRMVVPPQREGGQRQYVEAPMPAVECDTLESLLSWAVEHLDEDLTVESMAAHAHLSPRTLARRFRAETGATPYDWLVGQRVLLARRLLEDTDLPVEHVAQRCGFGAAAVLRHHFTRRLGTSPAAYRRAFAQRGA